MMYVTYIYMSICGYVWCEMPQRSNAPSPATRSRRGIVGCATRSNTGLKTEEAVH